jgi:outer membrane lipopolysaccharide assembly protein LptE/RlpB
VRTVKNLRIHRILPPYFIFVVFLASCFMSGCGYRFRGAGVSIGVSLDTIAIPIFPSTSSFLGYEADFTRILREQFITHSRARIVSKEKAQAVLSGTIRSMVTQPLTYSVTKQTIHGYTSTDAVTSSREMRVQVEAQLVDTVTGAVIWQDASFAGEAGFSVSSDPLRTGYDQRQAFIAIAREIATRIYSKTMERF